MKDKIIDATKNNIFPFLYCFAIMFMVVSLYSSGDFIELYSVVSAIYILICFFLFGFVGKHKFVGAVAYIFAGIFIFFISGILIFSDKIIVFAEWIFSGGEVGESTLPFMFAIILTFGYFFSSVIYYYFHVNYKISVMTIIGIIPFLIYVKAVENIPFYMAVIMVTLLVTNYIINSRKRSIKGSLQIGKRTTVVSYVDFIVAVILFAIILPKPSVAPFYEDYIRFTEHFSVFRSADEFVGDYSDISDNSDNMLAGESRNLYFTNISTDENLKVQSFAEYDSDSGYFVDSSNDVYGYKNWENFAVNLNYSDLIDAYVTAEADILSGIPSDSTVFSAEDSLNSAMVYAVDFPTRYISAPFRTTSVEFMAVNEKNSGTPLMIKRNLYDGDYNFVKSNPNVCYRTSSGEFFSDSNYLPNSFSYRIYYYSSNFFRENNLFDSGICDVSYEDFGEVLNSLVEFYSYDEDSIEYKTVSTFFVEHKNSQKYSADKFSAPSSQVKNLAREITAGAVYDYEKALAIEEFLSDGNKFRFDLGYENSSCEEFLFDSFRGKSSDFTSAFVELCRASGLKVRYNEGFSVGDRKENSDYSEITTELSYAYPEVYISGASWQIFEPTVGGGAAALSTENENSDEDFQFATFLAVVISAFIVVVLAVLLLLFYPILDEVFFRVKLRFTSHNDALILIYRRFIYKLSLRYSHDFLCYTPKQLDVFYSEKTAEHIFPITDLIEKNSYALEKISAEEFRYAYCCYKKNCKTLNKIKKCKGAKFYAKYRFNSTNRTLS